MASNNSRAMLGKHCPVGPGGRDCVCCGQAPGKERKRARRLQRRRENSDLRKFFTTVDATD